MTKKITFLALTVLLPILTASGQSPNYGSGFTSTGLTLNGGATISGTHLRLTDGGTGEARSAFYNTQVNVQSFTNNFSFQLTNANADGFTFTIQGVGATAVGGGGGSLGYGPTSSNGTGGIANSIAVGFQLYSTALGNIECSLTGDWTNGASPAATPGTDTTGSGVNLHSGDVMNVHMTYDGTTLTWTITDASTGKSFTKSVAVNIPALTGNNAYVGFTGGTGGLSATQDIITWTYTSGTGATPPSITTQPASQTVVAGQTATFSVVASGTTPLSYQWQKNAANISGATSSSYTTPATTSADNGSTYDVIVSNTAGSVTSNNATLTVTSSSPAVNFGSGFTSAGLTLNGGAIISGTRLRLTDGGSNEARTAFFNTPVNVQSFVNDFSFQLTNATADGFTFTIQNNNPTVVGVQGGGLAYSSIGNSIGVGFQLYSGTLSCSSTCSLTGDWTNGASPAATPGTDTTGSGVNLHSGDVMNVHMTYDGTTLTWTITDASTGKSFTKSVAVNIPALTTANTAYVGFTGATGGLTATQDIISWTYTPGSGSPVAPTITTQPANQTVTVGQTATFSVVASGTAPLSYQWFQNTGAGFTSISGATSSSYTTPATTSANNGNTFEVTVTNSAGSVTSNAATLTVNAATPPSITTQPANQTVAAGQTATFSVVASGSTPLSYQWYQNTGTGFTAISGATASSYTTPATTSANNGNTFGVTVTNSAGSVTSNAATLTVTSAGSGVNFGSGFTSSGLTFNGGATLSGTRLRVTDGGSGEARSAFFNTAVNVQSFTNDFSFQLTNATADGFTFTIQGNTPTAVGNGGGGLGYSGIGKSAAVKLDLYNNSGEGNDSTGLYTNGASPTVPATDMTSSGVNLHSGDVMNVHMTYDGTTLTWTVTDSTAGKSFTTSAAINIPGLTGNSAYVGFTGGTGGATAVQDILTWTYTPSSGSPTAPSIVTQPVNQTVAVGQTATFSVVASGTTPLSYQWYQNTGAGFTAIPGATSSSYTTPATTNANNGNTFEVTVTNSVGSVTSNVATLTVTSTVTSVNFGGGFTSTGLTFNGGATLSGTRLRVTDGGTGEARSAFYNVPVNIQSFINDFKFQLTNANADGLTFTIQANNPNALGTAGGGLGYSGIANSVAVKFDLYSNAGEGNDSTGLYTNGATPTVPAVDMTSSGVNLHSGDVMNVHMAYDGATLRLQITDTNTGAFFGTSFAVNIPSTIGTNSAFVGFTGGTGGLTATQDVLTWIFNSVPVTAFAWPVDTPITYGASACGGNNDYSTYCAANPIYGQYHTGIDVCPQTPGCALGNPVYSTSSGVVELALVVNSSAFLCDGSAATGYQINPSTSNLGNVIVIAHPNGKFSLYGHLDCIWPGIVPGVQVSAGTRIGNQGHSALGDQDRTFTPHTHFEMKDRAVTGDPTNKGYSGYTTDLPDGYGYHDARIYLNPFTVTGITPVAVKVTASPTQAVTAGPGASFAFLTSVATNQEFVAFASSGSWYEIYLPNDVNPVAGWIPASSVTTDSSATLMQVTGASSSGLAIEPGANSSPTLVSWDQTFGNCAATAKIWNGQWYVRAGSSQNGFNEFYLPLTYYFSSSGTCAVPSGPGPSVGWASSTFLH